MTRDELEAVIWHQARKLATLSGGREAMDAILAAADDYAVYTGGITAGRRREIDAARRPPKIHRKDEHRPRLTVCGLPRPPYPATADRRAVTCRRCSPWQDAPC